MQKAREHLPKRNRHKFNKDNFTKVQNIKLRFGKAVVSIEFSPVVGIVPI